MSNATYLRVRFPRSLQISSVYHLPILSFHGAVAEVEVVIVTGTSDKDWKKMNIGLLLLNTSLHLHTPVLLQLLYPNEEK